MKLLANSQVLLERKQGSKNIFKVNNLILEYIAISEKNALKFLYRYIEKVLQDSGIYYDFENFFQSQKNAIGNKDKLQFEYNKLKQKFYDFTHLYTKIKKDLECGRIFTKVINPVAYFHNAFGTEGGHVSSDVITFDVLMYNIM